MASNPMQRKTRNSFLLGMLATLVVTGTIIALLLVGLKNKNEELLAEKNGKVLVYALNQNVKAAQVLTSDMFNMLKVHKDTIPSNATSSLEVIDTWFLQTKEGESVGRDSYGLNLSEKVGDKRVEVLQNTGNEFLDLYGEKVSTNDYYIEIVESSGKTYVKVKTGDIKKDKNGLFYINTEKTRLYCEENSTDAFYIYKTDDETANTNDLSSRVKEYVAIKNVPVIAKVDMNAKTVITPELVVQSSEVVTDDTRQEQYNMITLPIDLVSNDYVDIRLKTPGGQNFIVISKAKVDVPMTEDGTYIADSIKVNLREDEILVMSSAIVEAYGLEGELYVTKYVDPAMQEASVPTYTPNGAVTAQIQSNPNIVEKAKSELATRYSEAAKNARNQYLQQLITNAKNEGEFDSKVTQNMTEDMGSSLTTRQKYLESLRKND